MAKRVTLAVQVLTEVMVQKDRWEIKVKSVRRVNEVYQVNNTNKTKLFRTFDSLIINFQIR